MTKQEKETIFTFRAYISKYGAIMTKTADPADYHRSFDDSEEFVLKPTGRWRESKDSYGISTMYIESEVTLPVSLKVEKKVVKKWGFFGVQEWQTTTEVKESSVTIDVWVPEGHIYMVHKYIPTSEVFECSR